MPWDTGDDRKGSQQVEWTLNNCYVKAITPTSIAIHSKTRNQTLWFPRKISMIWVISRAVAGTPEVARHTDDINKGDQPVAVRLPQWLKEAKQQEVREAAEESRPAAAK